MKAETPWRLLPILLLASCSANQCNPNSAGLFSGIGCSVGSGYTQRTDTMTNEANGAKAQANQSYHQAVATQSADIAANNEVNTLDFKLSGISTQLNADQARLAALQTKTSAETQRKAVLQQEIFNLQSQIEAEKSHPSAQDVQVLAQKQQQEKRDLLNLDSNLGG